MKLFLLVLSLCTRLSYGSHFYGQEMYADVTSDSTQEIITIHWRLMWRNGFPSSETLTTCYSGSPCPSGPTSITMSPGSSNCNAQVITTVDGSATYEAWTGVITSLYYPITLLPPNGTTIGIIFQDSDWGLLSTATIMAYGGQLNVLTARRADKNLFNNTPRTAIAAIITVWPGCSGFSFSIPVVDPDGDPVQCRWSTSTAECRGCCYASYPGGLPFTLTRNCTVTYTGGAVSSNTYYAICIQMEDFYPTNQNVRISSASLQFIVEVATNPCSQAISPLYTDSCSLSMVAICSDNLSSVVPNSVIISNYSNIVGSSVILSCASGYSPSSNGSVIVNCVAFNSSKGVWVASAGCFRTNFSLNCNRLSAFSHTQVRKRKKCAKKKSRCFQIY